MGISDDDLERFMAPSAQRAAISGEELARVLGAFRKTLLAEGFPADTDEVRELTLEFFLAMLHNPAYDEDED